MARGPDPTNEILRALLARSGNRCAFPGCTQTVVNAFQQFVAQVCHIEAAARGGERFNPSTTDEDRRAYQNLLILCYAHHVETNDVRRFPVEAMRKMKQEHEARFAGASVDAADAVVAQMRVDLERYWAAVAYANTVEHEFPDLAAPVNVAEHPRRLFVHALDLVAKLRGVHASLSESNQSLPAAILDQLRCASTDTERLAAAHEVARRDWEYLALAFPNLLTRLTIVLYQCQIAFLMEFIASNPSDEEARRELADAQAQLLEAARTWGLAD